MDFPSDFSSSDIVTDTRSMDSETEFYSPDFGRELQALRTDLVTQFRLGYWAELSKTLNTLAKLGESQGRKEISLRAQSLRELMGDRAGGGRTDPGEPVSRIFNDLLFHLSHLQWVSQTSH